MRTKTWGISKHLIRRILKLGLSCGILIFVLGFANVSDVANPPAVVTLSAPYSVELLVVGIVTSAITGAGLLLLKETSHY